MPGKYRWSVLLYGNSSFLESVKRKLWSVYGMQITHIDPASPMAQRQLADLEAHLLICDQENKNPRIVTAFLEKNPFSPVVDLGTSADCDLEITYQKYSRLETCGLPQVLLALGY